jgi:hypothetical protein
MSLTTRFARRLWCLACTAGGAILVAGTLAGFAAGLFCVNFAASATGAPQLSADGVCRNLLRFGTTCLLTGLAIALFLAVSRGWPRPVPAAEPTTVLKPVTDGERQASGWLLLLASALIALPVGTVLAAIPALGFVDQHFERLSQSLDGMLLLAPLFGLTTTATLFVGELAVLLLFLARQPLFPRVYIVLAMAHLGFLLGLHNALEGTRLVTALAGSQFPILQQHDETLVAVVRHLRWLLGAHGIALPLVLLSGAVRTTFARRLPGSPYSQPLLGIPAAMAPRQPEASAVSLQRGAVGVGPFQGAKYFVRATYLSWPLAGVLKVNDLDSGRTFTARIVPLQLRPTIEVYSERRERTQILEIKSRGILAMGAWFDILDGATHGAIGAVKKQFASDWLIHDRQSQPIGVVTQRRASLGFGEYVAYIGQHPVASFSWSNVLKPALGIELSGDIPQLLDRRLGIALGVLLFVNRSFASH